MREPSAFSGLYVSKRVIVQKSSQLLRLPAGGGLPELPQLSRGGVHPEKVASLSEGTTGLCQ